MSRLCLAVIAGGLLLLCSACTAFSNVRSAVVSPGPAFSAQASVASPPGKEAFWFYSWDCYECNDIIPSVDLGLTFGWVPSAVSAKPLAFGFGLDGYHLKIVCSAPRR